ncbi:DUF1768-domain-containing protein [Meredithblackwellia eburnea MCA 4105]
MTKTIEFFRGARTDGDYYQFSNFAPFGLVMDGKYYPTTEHYFQSEKFTGDSSTPEFKEEIRNLATAHQALKFARKHRATQRSDWFDINIQVMDDTVRAKFTQNEELRTLLLETGDKKLVEASPFDGFWGWGKDKTGRNELGKCLMRLRDELLAEQSNREVSVSD